MKSSISLVVIALCIGAYFLYINPSMADVKVRDLQRKNYSDLLQQSKDVISKRDAIFNNYSNISSGDIDKLNKIVPETFNPVLFANDLNVMASSNSMSVKDLKVSPLTTESQGDMTNPQPAKAYVTTVVTFSVAGRYDQFINFLRQLESSLRLMDVVGLSIKSGGGQGTASDLLQYSLVINTYSLR